MSLRGRDGSSLMARVRPLLGWEVLRGDRHADTLRTMENILGTVEDDLFPGAIIPRLIDWEMHYYAVAPTHAQQQRLSSLLRASVGRTITDFSGQSVSFNEWDELGALLIDNAYPSGFRFTAGSDVERGKYATAALARLRHLVDQGGSVSANQPRTTPQELRRFELSLAAYDRRGAEQAIQFLRSNMRLDAVNLGAMTVRLHSRFQEWEQICQLESFPSLCRARRAAKITDLLAEAVYRTHILTLEDEEDPSRLIPAFNESVQPIAGNLFGSFPEYLSPIAGRAFLLAAGASDPPDNQLAERLRSISDHWLDEDREAFETLWHRVIQDSPGLEAEVISAGEEYQRQIETLLSGEPCANLDRARAGLIAAWQLETIEAFQAVVEYVEKLGEEARETLLSNQFNRRAYESMVEQSAGTFSPENWTEWIGVLDRDDLSVPPDFALSTPDRWRVSEHLRDGRRVSELMGAIENVAPAAEDRLFDVLPSLVQWLQSDPGWPNSSLLALYRTIYNRILLHLTVRWSKEAAGVARELLQAMLELGADREDYAQLLDDMGDALPTGSGRTDAGVFLELAETIVDYGFPDPDSRFRLWLKIVDGLRSVGSRLSADEVVLANDIGQVFGIDEVFPVSPEAGEATAGSDGLAGKMVAVYTLTESVAQRIARLLEKLHPGVRVELANDSVGSRRLEELARRADIFVVCWRSATHAATEFIKRNRPTGSPPIYPAGNGSSSVLRLLQERYSN